MKKYVKNMLNSKFKYSLCNINYVLVIKYVIVYVFVDYLDIGLNL